MPRPAVGLVIGKGGDMIKKIQQDTGARVQFKPGNIDILVKYIFNPTLSLTQLSLFF